MKNLTIGAILIILALGGWYGYQTFVRTGGAEMSYAYACDNGAQFSVSPAEDFSWVVVIPGEQAPFEQQVLPFQDNINGLRYENAKLGIVGSGTDILLGTPAGTSSCAIVEGTDALDWGAVDGTAVQQDIALIVAQDLIGKWRGNGQTTFDREFKDGTYTDTVGSKQVNGLWFAFTSENAPPVNFPVEKNRVYLQMSDPDQGVAYLQVASKSLTGLVLAYMDRPGVLTFQLVE